MESLTKIHTEAVNRRRQIIDLEDANTPFEALDMDIGEWIEHRFNLIDTSGCQIDTVFWDVGMSEDSYAVHLNSKLLEPYSHPGLNRWREQGIDWIKTLVDESHKRGLEVFWSHRIGAIDSPQPFCDCEFDDPCRENPLKTAHPDWTNKCWWPQGLWNLANQELRKHKLRFLSEIIEQYDFDGFLIDFARHTPCLPLGKEWIFRNEATQFVCEVRNLLLKMEHKKNKAILLAVRTAENIPGCHADGFDVEQWAKDELVDIFMLGGRTSEVNIDDFRRITAGKNIKLCPVFDGHHANDGYYCPPIEYYRGVFSNWLQQGADCVAIFNWPCSNAPQHDELAYDPAMRSPALHQAVFEVGTLESMCGKNKMYAVERRGGYPYAGSYLYRNDDKPLPLKITRDKLSPELKLAIHEQFDPMRYTARLDVILWHVQTDDILKVQFNDVELKLLASDNSWLDGQIYCDKPQPVAGNWSCFAVDPKYKLLKVSYKVKAACVKNGLNNVKISFQNDILVKTMTIEKIELTFLN